MENDNLTEENYNEIVKVRREKLKNLVDAGKNPFEKVRFERTAYSADVVNNFSEFDGKSVRLAGRLLSKRVMGKASFAHLLDGKGKIQLYVSINDLGEEQYAEFKKSDIGDIFGIEGEVFMTHKGEVSVKAKAVELLSKSLLPLPEKFHGLKDNDQIGRAHV